MTPDWLTQLASALPELTHADLSRHPIPDEPAREAAVLILFGPNGEHGDVLIIERASTMSTHAGQPAFPGGRVDVGDTDSAHTALREAQEETGLNPQTVEVLGILPELWLPPSQHRVTPVVGWWHSPHELQPTGTGEVTAIHRVPISDLANPANRGSVRHPNAGHVGPGFTVNGMLVWGFTAGLLSQLLRIGGWSRAWDPSRTFELGEL